MTNNELNKYIRHYIEKDHTNRAMMHRSMGMWEKLLHSGRIDPLPVKRGSRESLVHCGFSVWSDRFA